ncbi:MAG: glycosyl transferase, partial [Bacteroidetes bacterium]|nr:glycosyl transferase [Bacteroidota bacterium]
IRASINRIFHNDEKNVMTGYRAFRFRFVKAFSILSHGYEIETEMTIHSISLNMLLKNIVIKYRDCPEGSKSKLSIFSDGYRVIWTIINLFKDYKPLQFFSFVELILLIIDACIFIPAVWIPFKASHLVERFPTLIVCGFIAMAALLSFFIGIILDFIVKKERREFEFRLMQMMEKLKELSC